ncbi:hypothetical protein GC176_14045 [bacterium]|nr:hypothetical protein [bacterium]
MSRTACPALLLTFCLSLTGCTSCYQGGYYDPCGGCVYGPGFQKPSLLTKLFSKDKHHKHDRDCPLCAVEHEHGHSPDWSSPSCAAPSCAAPSCAAPNCSAPSCAAPNCSAPNCAASTPMSYPVSANCSAPSNCSCSGGVAYDSGPIVHAPSTCSSCGGFVESAPISSGCSGCSGGVVSGCSSCGGGMTSGDVIYDGSSYPTEGFGSGGCSACQGATIGPMYEGETIPGDAAGQPVNPAQAPPAETESSSVPGPPTTFVTPGPESTMMIPAFVEQPQPARQVHWVPSSLK